MENKFAGGFLHDTKDDIRRHAQTQGSRFSGRVETADGTDPGGSDRLLSVPSAVSA